MSSTPARELWKRVESIHAVTYFCAESLAAHSEVGLRGFWMGYFGSRAAPLGPVPAGAVEAAFFNFAPGMVRRAIPDAWTFATPAEILEARVAGAASALRRVCTSIDEVGANVANRLERIVDAAHGAGRVLFAANRELQRNGDAVETLWSLTTCVREHRGDGHVATLTTSGLDGCEVHVLFAADRGVARDVYLNGRGWTADEWDAAADRLADRDLVRDGTLTSEGRAVRDWIETRTDELAAQPLAAVDDVDALIRDLEPAALAVVDAGDIRFPNPMGLPRLDAAEG